jgi:hypothetical protein
MTDTPVPCHWCGGETRSWTYGATHYVRCRHCEAMGPWATSAEDAIANWNSIARVWRQPYGDDPAPTDGTEFLGLLTGGGRMVMYAPALMTADRNRVTFWSGSYASVAPYEPSLHPNYQWERDELRLIGWQPLPAAPDNPDAEGA